MKYPRVKMDTIKADVPYAFVGGPFGSNLTTRDYVEEGVPVIRGNNLSSTSAFYDDDYAFVSEEKAVQLTPNLAFSGDVIFTQRGTLGQVGVIPSDSQYDRYVISQSQMKLTVHPEKADALFVYYYFRIPDVVQTIINLSQSSGVPHINLGTLKNFEIPLPPLETQRRIIAFLSTYDDLIENNRRRIDLLEKSARMLYKEWFIYLRFPGHEHVKVKDGLPEGWEKRKFGNVVNNFDNMRVPLSVLEREQRPGIYPYHGAAGILSYIDEYIYDGRYVLIGEDGTVITPSQTPMLQFVEGKFWVSNHAHVIQGKDVSTEFIYYFLNHYPISGHITGVAQPKLTQANLNRIEVLLPTEQLLSLFQVFVEPLIEQQFLLKSQNIKLQQARDLLLPRLMNGEIVV